MKINYDGRIFRTVNNSDNGEVNAETTFYYHQQDDIVWATYSGGAVRLGTLVAKADEAGCLEMRYQHVNQRGELMTGRCSSTPMIMSDGKLRLREKWQWTSGDLSSGTSEIEEL